MRYGSGQRGIAVQHGVLHSATACAGVHPRSAACVGRQGACCCIEGRAMCCALRGCQRGSWCAVVWDDGSMQLGQWCCWMRAWRQRALWLRLYVHARLQQCQRGRQASRRLLCLGRCRLAGACGKAHSLSASLSKLIVLAVLLRAVYVSMPLRCTQQQQQCYGLLPHGTSACHASAPSACCDAWGCRAGPPHAAVACGCCCRPLPAPQPACDHPRHWLLMAPRCHGSVPFMVCRLCGRSGIAAGRSMHAVAFVVVVIPVVLFCRHASKDTHPMSHRLAHL